MMRDSEFWVMIHGSDFREGEGRGGRDSKSKLHVSGGGGTGGRWQIRGVRDANEKAEKSDEADRARADSLRVVRISIIRTMFDIS